jgi:hypothetical protein
MDDENIKLRWRADHPTLCLQVGRGLLTHFDGSAANLVASAKGSAVALVEQLTAHFPGFRDHAIYKGHQVRRCVWPQLPSRL